MLKKNIALIFLLISFLIIGGVTFIIWDFFQSDNAVTTETSVEIKEEDFTTGVDYEIDGTRVLVNNVHPIISDYDNRGEEYKVIPDQYNTGADLTKEMVTPEFYGEKGYIEKREEDYVMKLQDSSFDEETIVFENIFFYDLPLYLANNNEASRTGTIEFINCYFAQGIDLTKEVKKKLIFTNCDFLYAPVTTWNSEFYSCKFYESFGDALQIGSNVKVQDSYIYNNGLGDPEKYHSDGIQIAGFGNMEANNILVDNVRIEMPRLSPHFGQNSAMIIKMDMADGYDMTFKNMILNGGAFTLYIVPTKYDLKNVSFENIKFGNNSEWGSLYTNESKNHTDGWAGQKHKDSGSQKKVYVSSVREQDGSIVFCATNETGKDRSIRVETEQGESMLTVAHVLSVEEAKEADANYAEMNIDLEFQMENTKWIKIYDGNELIRYKEFN